jgi:hypothetical protein
MEDSVYKRQLFLCSLGNIRVVLWAMGREDAKRQARVWLGSDPDSYTVTSLSEQGDRVHISITLAI